MRKGENSAQKKRPQRERGERQGRPTSGECVIGGSPEAQNRLFPAPIRSKQSVLIHQNETAPARGAEAVGGALSLGGSTETDQQYNACHLLPRYPLGCQGPRRRGCPHSSVRRPCPCDSAGTPAAALSRAASSVRRAIHASYSGVPLRGGTSAGSPPAQ
jgi:hypothetical protein